MAAKMLLSDFPGVKMAFSYGSGVFTQHDNTNKDKNMLDVVFVVDNSFKWHEENLMSNRNHYSIVRVFGPRLIARLQDDFGANVYFNTLVPWKGRLIKYGVINKTFLIEDLVSWSCLYASGRLHKPVNFLSVCPADIQSALNTNLNHALGTSLLSLPETFANEELFMHITNLSYAGDFRMIIGENKDKVSNIVKPNLEHFRKLYLPLLQNDESVSVGNNVICQNCDVETRYKRLRSLPENLKKRIINWRMSGLRFEPFKNPSNELQDAVLYSLAHDPEKASELVLKGTKSIVRCKSISQSVKGIFTAGILKSITYSSRKLEKMVRGMIK